MIIVDYNASKNIEDACDIASGPTLDPNIPLFFNRNGIAALRQAHRVLHCGGWCTEAATFDEILKSANLPYPPTLEAVALSTKEGKELEVYAAQHLLISPIGFRQCWYDPSTNETTQQFFSGSRHWLQMIAMLGEKHSDTYIPWGPIALTAKGYQAGFILQALKEWETYTRPQRSELTRKLVEAGQWPDIHQLVSEKLFWMPLGTFGSTPKIVQVGKSAQSPITPITTYTMDGALDVALLEKLYIGEEAAQQAMDVLNQHRDWLSAWDNDDEPRLDSVEPMNPIPSTDPSTDTEVF